MIITKTPFRISLFGGGSDYPSWFKRNGGEVISTSINKYLYITLRELPNFFQHKYRIVYSKDEIVNNLKSIQHKPVREILKYFDIKKGIEIHYDGELPARSGVGSSSAFVVGLLNAIYKFNKKITNKKFISQKSIFFEREILRENVGWQDQIACSYGGFNNIKFKKNGSFDVSKINISKIKKDHLDDNLFLVYTKIQRRAHNIAKSFIYKLDRDKKRELNQILLLVEEAKKIFLKSNIDEIGKLLDETWKVKMSLSKKISNNLINEMYQHGISSGASGGKLLGAGGGGFFLFYVKKENQKIFKKKMNKFLFIPFKFENYGSKSFII